MPKLSRKRYWQGVTSYAALLAVAGLLVRQRRRVGLKIRRVQTLAQLTAFLAGGRSHVMKPGDGSLAFVSPTRFLFATAVLWNLLLIPAQINAQSTQDLTGTYLSDDAGVYYVQQSGNVVWWAGMSTDAGTETQWHRGLVYTNVFRGTFTDANTVTGEWANVSRGWALSSGTLTFTLGTSDVGSVNLMRSAATGGLKPTLWSQTSPFDDTVYDIFQRFDGVLKNDDSGSLHDNLKPYRDATVFYGRVVASHVDYLADEHEVESEIPHVNYGTKYPVNPVPADPLTCPYVPPCPSVYAGIPGFLDFGHENRDPSSFYANSAEGDGDFDVRLKIDLNKLEPNFYTNGWGDRIYGPLVFSLKLNDASTHTKLNYSASDAYMGSETIMYGKHDASASSLLPGWADADSNSVLLNGRPINGNASNPDGTTADPCYFLQPCPYLAGETPADLSQNYLVSKAGIQLGNLLESAYGDGLINDDGHDYGLGTYVRVTGALILDCGHFVIPSGYPCFDDLPQIFPDSVSTHQNQEIHPVYSVDIINWPFRPEDTDNARSSLTGAWGGNDGSTYYIRQIGNTIWWIGMLRDRQPAQPGNNFDIIGVQQVAAAQLLVGSNGCSLGSECWMFASVFKGTITNNADGSATIQGDWAGVPQSTSPGIKGSTGVTFTVNANHKVITPITLAGVFPDKLEKLYEPEDKTPPESGLVIGTPQYTNGANQLFVSGATNFTVTATDQDSGVQNIWYREFAPGGTAPFYTPVAGSTAIFTLNGADGSYEVDSYATDNAGNDESSHSTNAALDAIPPVATIVQPMATQYGHSDPLPLGYSVSDGSGSGVNSFTPKMDGATAQQFGASLDSGQTLSLYSTQVGPHTFSVDSIDNVNNARTNSVTFTITVTFASLGKDVINLETLGCIDNIGQSLTAKINAAQNLYGKGQIQTAINILAAAIYEVQAQAGKHIANTCADPSGRLFNPVQFLLGDLQYMETTLASQLSPDPVMGTVTSSSNAPISGATVNLMTSAKTIAATAITDAAGFYYLPDVSGLSVSNKYMLMVTLPKGFKNSSLPSQTFTWSGRTVLGNFSLY